MGLFNNQNIRLTLLKFNVHFEYWMMDHSLILNFAMRKFMSRLISILLCNFAASYFKFKKS